MSTSVKHGLILAGGAGTGLFPSTISKSFRPFDEVWVESGELVAREVSTIGYLAEDLAAAGLKHLKIVTPGRIEAEMDAAFNDINVELALQVERASGPAKVDKERARRSRLGFESVKVLVQPPDIYGTEEAVAIGEEALRNEGVIDSDRGTGEPVLITNGDVFFYRSDRDSEYGAATAKWGELGTDHLLVGMRVPLADAGKFGLLRPNDDGGLVEIIEKPDDELLYSTNFRDMMHIDDNGMLIANLGTYAVGPKLWKTVKDKVTQPDSKSGERYFTDTFKSVVAEGQTAGIYIMRPDTRYMDVGSPIANARNQQHMLDNPRECPPRF